MKQHLMYRPQVLPIGSFNTNSYMAANLDSLSDEPTHFPDCCPGVSNPLVMALADRLPPSPALILLIGSGSGLLEALVLQSRSKGDVQPLNIYDVEVPAMCHQASFQRASSHSSLYNVTTS